MLIGLISDTHIPEAARELPPQVFEHFRGVDLILHAGDMHDVRVLDMLEALAPVKCARGNGDMVGRVPSAPPDPRVQQTQVLRVGGLSLGMVHDFPAPNESAWSAFASFMDHFFGGRMDVVVCGHTHQAVVLEREGTLFVNPGSTALPNNRRGLGTIALLQVVNGTARADIIQL